MKAILSGAVRSRQELVTLQYSSRLTRINSTSSVARMPALRRLSESSNAFSPKESSGPSVDTCFSKMALCERARTQGQRVRSGPAAWQRVRRTEPLSPDSGTSETMTSTWPTKMM